MNADLWILHHRPKHTLILLWGELDFFTPVATVLSATCSMEGECHAKPLYLFDPALLCPRPHVHMAILLPWTHGSGAHAGSSIAWALSAQCIENFLCTAAEAELKSAPMPPKNPQNEEA